MARRVLHLIDTTGPGGAETIFLALAAGLRPRGYEPVVALVGPGWVLESARTMKLPVEITPTAKRFDLAYLRRLRDVVRRERVELIQAHLFSPVVYSSALAAWTGVPVVGTLHGASDAEAGGLTRRLRYRMISAYAQLVCVSLDLRRQLVEQRLAAPANVRVIPNGVELAPFAQAEGDEVRRELGAGQGTLLVGALGNIRPAKDYANFIRAASLLAADQRFRFVIAGERSEPLHQELVTLRDVLGLRERLDFLGFRRDTPAVLAALDALVISSESEGFSLAAVQAMAAGTPVVATRCGGPEEIITDGKDGLLVPAGQPHALAAGVTRMLSDASLRDRIVRNGRRTAHDRFSVERMLDEYERLYQEVLGRRVRVPAVRSRGEPQRVRADSA